MSTYHYIVCDKHKEYCGAVSDSAGGVSLHSEIKSLLEFFVVHSGCDVRILSEHSFYDIIGEYKDIEKQEGETHG